MLRLVRAWVACLALALLPAPSAAPLLLDSLVTVSAQAECAELDEAAPEAPAAARVELSPPHVAARGVEPAHPLRAIAPVSRGALYLENCALLL